MGIQDTDMRRQSADEQIADQDNRRVVVSRLSDARSNKNVWNTITPGRKAYLESPEGQAETARNAALYEVALANKLEAENERAEKNRLERNRKAREARAARGSASRK